MIWMLAMVAGAEEKGTELRAQVESPKDRAASFEAWDTRLKAALAVETWSKVKGAGKVDPKASDVEVAQAVLEASSFADASEPHAWKSKHDEGATYRSNVKVLRDGAGRVTAAAFGVTDIWYGERSMAKTNTDFLVAYEEGKPTHLYVSERETFGEWEKSLWTLQTDASGKVLAATSAGVKLDFSVEAKPVSRDDLDGTLVATEERWAR